MIIKTIYPPNTGPHQKKGERGRRGPRREPSVLQEMLVSSSSSSSST
jgi:hypothetical protein